MWFDRDSAQFILGTAVLHCSNTVNNCSTSITNQPTNQLLSILSFQFVRMLWGMGVCHALPDVCLQPDGPSCYRGCDDTHGPSGRLRRYQLCRGVQQGPPVCPVLLKGYQQCHVGFSSTWVHFYDFLLLHHDIEILFALLSLWEGNTPVTGAPHPRDPTYKWPVAETRAILLHFYLKNLNIANFAFLGTNFGDFWINTYHFH